MPLELSAIERRLASDSKWVRLNALKHLFRHPQASPVQLARGLCSPDLRNFEFLDVFDMHPAMRRAWERLAGVEDDEVYEYLNALYSNDPAGNAQHVGHILELIRTPRALKALDQLLATCPLAARRSVDFSRAIVLSYLHGPPGFVSLP